LLAGGSRIGPLPVVAILPLHNADFAHVTRDDAAEAKCFRYLRKFFGFVIANFRGVITKGRAGPVDIGEDHAA
jgi:hypothetical protein